MSYWLRRKPYFIEQRMVLEQLEERIVLDAAAPATSQDKPDNQVDQAQTGDQTQATAPGQAAELSGSSAHAAEAAAASAPSLAKVFDGQDPNCILITNLASEIQIQTDSTTTGDSEGPKVLLVSSNVQGSGVLAEAAQSGVIKVLYDAAHASPGQIVNAVAEALGGQKAQSIGIAAHDVGDGAFQLTGSFTVTSGLLATSPELQSFWQGLGGLLAQDGRIDILSCNLAATDQGKEVVSQIERLSGHDVAASDDPTGNSAYGGDWILETGNVDAAATYFVAGRLDQFEGRLVTIDLGGNTGWKTLMTGTLFDPARDQQAQKATTDLSGDNSHAVLYTQYDDKGTATTTDDDIAYRVRVGGADSGGSFSSVILLGIDADQNGDIDIFVTVQDVENGIKLWYPGGNLNVSPNTTSTESSSRVFSLIGNYDFSAVSASTDPNWNPTPNTDVNSYNGPDYFVSFKLPFSAIKDQLAETGITGNPPGGITITPDSPLRYVLGTSTQTNAFNSDIGGVGQKDSGGTNAVNSTMTWEQLGAFSPLTSASNMFPVITSDGGGATASKTVAHGTSAVTTVVATDQDQDVVSYSISGGVDQSLFTINPVTGELKFINPPNFFIPLDSNKDGNYVVQVSASDGKGGTDVQTFTVTVANPPGTAFPKLTALASPDGGAVLKDAPIFRYVFDEPILPGSGNITLTEVGTTNVTTIPFGVLTDVAGGGGAQVITSISGSELIMQFTGSLNPNKDYTVNIPAGYVKDFANHDFPGFNTSGDPNDLTGANDLHDFRTRPNKGDELAPSVTINTPVDDQINVSVTTDLVLWVNEATIGGTGSFKIYEQGVTNPVQTISATEAKVTYDNSSPQKKITLDIDDLKFGTQYYVLVDSGAVSDLYGNVWTGISSSTAWNFTTASTDGSAAPTVTTVSATNSNGTWIAGDKIYVQVNFSENVYVTGGTPTLTLETGDTDRTATYVYGSGSSTLMFVYTVQAGDRATDLITRRNRRSRFQAQP